MPTNRGFWVFAAIASVGFFIVTLLLPFGLPFGVAGQVVAAAAAGVFGSLWFVRAYPDAQLTPRNVFFLTPWWIWAGFAALIFVSGLSQGVGPFQMVGTLLLMAALFVGLPWFLWWCVRDLFKR